MLLNLKALTKRKELVLKSASGLVVLAALEISMLVFGFYTAFYAFSALTFFMGALCLFALHYGHFKSRSGLIEKLLLNLVQKAPDSLAASQCEKLISEDFYKTLSGTYLFTPKSYMGESEFKRVKGLSDFLVNYKASRDFKILDKEAQKVLQANKAFTVSFSEILFDLSLLSLPFLLSSTPLLTSKAAFVSMLLGFRLVTIVYYLRHAQKHMTNLKEAKLQKLDHFLNGDFPKVESLNTRIQMEELLDLERDHRMLLIDKTRKKEVEDVVRAYAREHKSFSDWSVISIENSVYKSKVEGSKAFILFPSEMLFPFEEMKDFIKAFDEVILVDSLPTVSLKETAVFYLDHDQRLKEVKPHKNQDRLSGDKGLILRNLEKNKLKDFMVLVEDKIKRKDCFFLLAESTEVDFSEGPSFTFPSKERKVCLVEELTDFGEAFYCEVGRGKKEELLLKVKNFIANVAYPQLYSHTEEKQIIEKTFKAS